MQLIAVDMVGAPISFISQQHDFFELIYYFEGKGAIEFEGQKYPFSKGSMFLIPPQTLHTEVAEIPMRSYVLLFRAQPDELVNYVLPAQDNILDAVYHLFTILYFDFYSNIHNKAVICNNLFNSILDKVFSLSLTLNSNPFIEEAEYILTQNIGNPSFRIETAFDSIALSYSQLRRVFKEKHGISMKEYLLNRRIQYAQTLMISYPALLIKEIANRCGFDDQLYFSRLFKRKIGVYPKQYRLYLKDDPFPL